MAFLVTGLTAYTEQNEQQLVTASLFEAAAAMGAIAAEVDAAPWRKFGQIVGRAYQAADDLADATRAESELGKSTGRDAALGRPSIVRTYGVTFARRRVAALVAEAMDSVPACSGSAIVHTWLTSLSKLAGEHSVNA
jgi:geranylgeranyl pyrophosphate synthase